MKKTLYKGALLCMALCAALIFMGCPADDEGEVWAKEITDLVVSAGTRYGEINYRFTATEPAADSYELYYIKGAKSEADEITAGPKITPQFSGAISGLEAGETYSVVVIAQKSGFEDAISEVKQAKAMESFTLTITGVPSPLEEGKIIGASLMNILAPTVPVAIGIDMLMSGTFTFYQMAPPDSPLPVDLTKPFNKAGTYLLALVEADLADYQELADLTDYQKITVYIYTGGAQLPKPVTFPTADSLAWADFVKQSLGQQGP